MNIFKFNNDMIEYKSIELLEEYLVLPFLPDSVALEIVKTIDSAPADYIAMTFNEFSNSSIVDMELFYHKLRYLQYAYPDNPYAASVEKKVLEEKSYFSLPIHDIGATFHYVSNDFIVNFVHEKNIPKHPLIMLYEEFVEHIEQYLLDQDHTKLTQFWTQHADYFYPEDTRMRDLFHYDFKDFPSDEYDTSEDVRVGYNVYYIALKDLRRQIAITFTEHFLAQPQQHLNLAKNMPGFFDFSRWLEEHEQKAFACRFMPHHVALLVHANGILGDMHSYIFNLFTVDNLDLRKYAYAVLNIAKHKEVLLPLFQGMCINDDYTHYWKERLNELTHITNDSIYNILYNELNNTTVLPSEHIADIVAYANQYIPGAKKLTHHAIDLLGCVISYNKTPHNIALHCIDALYSVSQHHACLYLIRNSDYAMEPNLKIDELYSSLEYMRCRYPQNNSISGLLQNLHRDYIALTSKDNIVDSLWHQIHRFSFPDARLDLLEQYMEKHNIAPHPLVQKHIHFAQAIEDLHSDPENIMPLRTLWAQHNTALMYHHNELNTSDFTENTGHVNDYSLDDTNTHVSRIYRMQIRLLRYKIEEALFRYFIHYPKMHNALTMPPFFAFGSHLSETQKLCYTSLFEQHHIDALLQYNHNPSYHVFIMGTFRIGKYATHSHIFLDLAKRSSMFDPLFVHADIPGNSLKGFWYSHGALSSSDEKALKEIENVFIIENYEKMQKELPVHGKNNKRSKI